MSSKLTFEIQEAALTDDSTVLVIVKRGSLSVIFPTENAKAAYTLLAALSELARDVSVDLP